MSLWEMDLVGSFLIVGIFLARSLAGQRLPKRGFLLLWEIAALRLLAPVMMPAPFPIKRHPATMYGVQSSPAGVSNSQLVSPPMQHPVTNPVENAAVIQSMDWKPLLGAVWAVVCVGMAAWFVWSYLRSRIQFAQSLPDENAWVQAWKASHPLRRSWQVRISDQITSPLTYGVVHPVILLPKSLDHTDTNAMQGILTHEWTHIRRFDAVAKILFAAALCLHWWNPLVWVMYRFANQDMELACDETVVKRLGREKRSDYAMMLIDMAQQQTQSPILYANLTQKMMQERIMAIMNQKKTSYLAMGMALVLILFSLMGFALGEQQGFTVLAQTDRVSNLHMEMDGMAVLNENLDENALWQILVQAEREAKATAVQEDLKQNPQILVSYTVKGAGGRLPEREIQLYLYQQKAEAGTILAGFLQDGEKVYHLLEPEWVNQQIRTWYHLDVQDPNQVIQAILDSITWKRNGVQFTIPSEAEHLERFTMQASSRMRTENGTEQEKQFLQDEIWQAGKQYFLPYNALYTQWEMHISYLRTEGEKEISRSVNLLDFRPQLQEPETIAELSQQKEHSAQDCQSACRRHHKMGESRKNR